MSSASPPLLSEGVWAEKVEGETVRRFNDCCLKVFPNGFIRLKPYDQVSSDFLSPCYFTSCGKSLWHYCVFVSRCSPQATFNMRGRSESWRGGVTMSGCHHSLSAGPPGPRRWSGTSSTTSTWTRPSLSNSPRACSWSCQSQSRIEAQDL